MEQSVFRKLQQRLDLYSLGFPATASGIEIKILKELFTEDDAAMFLSLSPMLETSESVAGRLSQPIESVSARLEDMAERKLLFRVKKPDSVKYSAVPFVHGLFEFRVSQLDKPLAEMLDQYYREGFREAMIKGADTFLRTIPISEAIAPEQHIAPYEDVKLLLKNMKQIVVTDCICRKQQMLTDKGCGKPLEVCFMFGSMGQYYLDHRMGRRVEADEALQIVAEAQAAGLVTQPATAQNPGGMCNCCGDCCGVLASLNDLEKPAEAVFSNWFAEVNASACSGCETCIDRCQMKAITMNSHDTARISRDRCIGCGLCVITCPEEALFLVQKPEDQRRIPPATGMEQMLKMAEKRGITF